MRITLDGSEISLSEEAINSGRSAVYEEVRTKAAHDGRIISNITVDGVEMDDDAFCHTTAGQDIAFTSQSVRSLLSESIEEGSNYLPKLIAGVGAIALKFENGDDDDAKNMLANAVEGINWIFGIFDKICGIANIRPENLRAGRFSEDSEHIKTTLNDMNTAMEAGDDSKLAFIMRDSLQPVLEKFKKYWDEAASMLDAPVQ